MSSGTKAASNPFRQPRAVWAVAFACVISFMGIGLVDPILPALAHNLHATPSQVSLLFTSYLVVTAVMMLAVGWISSRIGAKRTLVYGLILIVVFAALAGTASSVNGIVGFRAGWGLGNAMFIATSLAVIVASATGGFAGAIILYETALGLGIAVGPLLGGELGSISWRGPFFGVSVLMAIALIATILFVPSLPKPAHKTSLGAPLKALRHRGLLTMGIMALLYNWGFFTMLGYAPYPMELDAQRARTGLHRVGSAGGGVQRLLRPAAAGPVRHGQGPVREHVRARHRHDGDRGRRTHPRRGDRRGDRQRRLHRHQQHAHHPGGHARVTGRAAGRLLGVRLRPVHRRRAGAVRGRQARRRDQPERAVLSRRRHLPAGDRRAGERPQAGHGGRGGAVRAVAARGGRPPARAGSHPVVVAVGATADAGEIVEAAAAIARDLGAPLEVVRVRETVVIEELAVDPEDEDDARAAVSELLDQLSALGVAATGQILRSVGDHAAAGRVLARHADEIEARTVAVGRSPRGPASQFAEGSFTSALTHATSRTVVLVSPGATPHELTAAVLSSLRGA